MDNFIFRTSRPETAPQDTVAIDDIPGESQRLDLVTIWGTNGVALAGPDPVGMHVDPVIPGAGEADFLFA
jgi:hypothetical protein